MDEKRIRTSRIPGHGQTSSRRNRVGSVLAQDQPAVDELCKILARILRRMNDNDSSSSVID